MLFLPACIVVWLLGSRFLNTQLDNALTNTQVPADIFIALLELPLSAASFSLVALVIVEFVFAAGAICTLIRGWIERRNSIRAWRDYSARWSCLYSHSDEAITGLRATVVLAGNIVNKPQWNDARLAFRSRRFGRICRGILKMLNPIAWLTAIYGPLIDSFIWTRLRRAMQGLDRWFLETVAVETAPVPGVVVVAPIDSSVDSELLASANAAAPSLVHVTRASLTSSWTHLEGVAAAVAESLSYDVLVHNRYMANRSVIQSICDAIQLSKTDHCQMVNRRESQLFGNLIREATAQARHFCRLLIASWLALVALGIIGIVAIMMMEFTFF